MQFNNARVPVGRPGGGGGGGATTTGKAAVSDLSLRPVDLTMYKELPSGEVSVEEFEQYALDRLRGERFSGLGCWFGKDCKLTTHDTARTLRVWRCCCCLNCTAVLKALEEAKLRGKTDEDLKASGGVWVLSACMQRSADEPSALLLITRLQSGAVNILLCTHLSLPSSQGLVKTLMEKHMEVAAVRYWCYRCLQLLQQHVVVELTWQMLTNNSASWEASPTRALCPCRVWCRCCCRLVHCRRGGART